jgi:predicted nucleotidyltransferase
MAEPTNADELDRSNPCAVATRYRAPGTADPVMTAQETIRQAVDRLAADPLTQRIILFGSQARGDADAGSDIDLLVIEHEVRNRAAEMVRLRRLLRPLPAAFDVLVYSQDEVASWGQQPGTALYWALKEGKVLHG